MPVQNTDNALRTIMATIRNSFSPTIKTFLSGANALPVASGGTGATTAADARNNLALGACALLNIVPIANGGTGQATPIFAMTGDETAGTFTITLGGGAQFKITWKDATFAANMATGVTFHSAFSTFSKAWVNGGENSGSASQNNPYVLSSDVNGCQVVNAVDSPVSGTVFAFGV